MIQFLVTVRSDFSKVLLQQFHREQLLGACRMEDSQQTTEQEKNDMLLCLEYYFNGVPFTNNGNNGSRNDALYAAFGFITASPLVRRWVERNQQPFGITLDLDLEGHTFNLKCSSMEEWMRMNRLFKVTIDN